MSALMGTVSVISGSIRPITFTVPDWGLEVLKRDRSKARGSFLTHPHLLSFHSGVFSRVTASMRFYDLLIEANRAIAGEQDSWKT